MRATKQEGSADIRTPHLLVPAIATLCLAACSGPAPQPPFGSQLAVSPAQNCAALGGKRAVERGAEGEIGVCVFAGNRQCEEWALLLGECAAGGIPVAGYVSTSERHCAIRGGRMTIPGCAFTPVGLYETGEVLLVLQAGRSAVLRSVHSGGSLASVLGTWQSTGKVVTVSTAEERLVFDYAGDRLVPREWDRRLWGEKGPGTLLRRK